MTLCPGNVHICKHTHFSFHFLGFTDSLKLLSGSASTFLKVWPVWRPPVSQMQIPGPICHIMKRDFCGGGAQSSAFFTNTPNEPFVCSGLGTTDLVCNPDEIIYLVCSLRPPHPIGSRAPARHSACENVGHTVEFSVRYFQV